MSVSALVLPRTPSIPLLYISSDEKPASTLATSGSARKSTAATHRTLRCGTLGRTATRCHRRRADQWSSLAGTGGLAGDGERRWRGNGGGNVTGGGDGRGGNVGSGGGGRGRPFGPTTRDCLPVLSAIKGASPVAGNHESVLWLWLMFCPSLASNVPTLMACTLRQPNNV